MRHTKTNRGRQSTRNGAHAGEALRKKRVKGGLMKKDASCTKGDRSLLLEHLYSTATTSTDCRNAVLVCLMWHVFGPASEMSLVRKQDLSV